MMFLPDDLEKTDRGAVVEQILTLIDHFGIRIDKLLGSVLALAAAYVVVYRLDRFLRRLLLAKRERLHCSSETLLFIVRFIDVALSVTVALLILNFWGVSVTGLWTILVSVSAVIGVGFLAVWTMISNITASFFLTIWRPFRKGDTVEVLPENFTGCVIDRDMMFTMLREQENGSVLRVPNNLSFQKIFRVTARVQQPPLVFSAPRHEDRKSDKRLTTTRPRR